MLESDLQLDAGCIDFLQVEHQLGKLGCETAHIEQALRHKVQWPAGSTHSVAKGNSRGPSQICRTGNSDDPQQAPEGETAYLFALSLAIKE